MTQLSASQLADYAAFLHRVARGIMVPCGVEPEDLAQDALLVGLQQAPRDPQRTKAWFRTIVRHRALDLQRKTARRLANEKNAQFPTETSSPIQLAEHRAAIKDLTAALDQLSLPDYELIRLRFFEGLNLTRVAETLSLARSTVIQREQKALAELRRYMEKKSRGSESLSLLAVSTSSLANSAKSAATKVSVLSHFGAIVTANKLALFGVILLTAMAAIYWEQNRTTDHDLLLPSSELESNTKSTRASRRAIAVLESDSTNKETEKAKHPVDRDHDLFGRVVDELGQAIPGVHLQSKVKDYAGLSLRSRSVESNYWNFNRSGARIKSALSDARGHFSMRHERGDTLIFLATKPGFASHKIMSCQAGERLEIVMQPAATLQVRVVDSEQRPVPEAWVAAYRKTQNDISPGGHISWLERTDESGEVEFPALAAGRTTVVAHLPDFGQAPPKIVEVDTKDRASIQLVIRADQNIVDLFAVNHGQIEIPGGVRVCGRVLGPKGKPLPSVPFRILGSTFRPSRIDDILGETGPDGRFSINPLLPSAPHKLIIYDSNLGGRTIDFDTSQAISIADELMPTVDLGDLTLLPGHAISGRIVGSKGQPQTRVPVSLIGWSQSQEQRAAETNDPRRPYRGDSIRVLKSDDIGRFFFKNLGAGSYRLRFGRSSSTQTKSITLSDEDITGLVLSLDSTRKVTIEVTSDLETDLTLLSVEVLEGESRLQSHYLDSTGITEFYLPKEGEFFIRPVLRQGLFEPMEKIRVGAGDSSITMALKPACKIEGVVRGPNGELLAGIEINLKANRTIYYTDERGRFSVAARRGSKIDLTLGDIFRGNGKSDSKGWLSSPFRGEVKGILSPQKNVVIHAKRIRIQGRQITVFVEDSRGRPLEGICVKSGGYGPSFYSENWQLTDRDGKVVFPELPKRVRKLFAYPKTWKGAIFAPSDPIMVQEDTTEYRAIMPEARWIRGHVRDQDGKPIVGVRVNALHKKREHASDFTTPTGTFELLVRNNFSYELAVRDLKIDSEIGRLLGVMGNEADITISRLK